MLEVQLRSLIERYLAHEIDRSDFAQQFADLYFQIRRRRVVSPEAKRLCDCVIGPFAELSRGHRAEESFREELTGSARPLAPKESRLPADRPS